MGKILKYNIDGKYYTVKEIAHITGISICTVRSRLNRLATTFSEIKSKPNCNQAVNWYRSMMNDSLGHWKLLAKALKPRIW